MGSPQEYVKSGCACTENRSQKRIKPILGSRGTRHASRYQAYQTMDHALLWYNPLAATGSMACGCCGVAWGRGTELGPLALVSSLRLKPPTPRNVPCTPCPCPLAPSSSPPPMSTFAACLTQHSPPLTRTTGQTGQGGAGPCLGQDGAEWPEWVGAAALVRFYFGDTTPTWMPEVPRNDGYKAL